MRIIASFTIWNQTSADYLAEKVTKTRSFDTSEPLSVVWSWYEAEAKHRLGWGDLKLTEDDALREEE